MEPRCVIAHKTNWTEYCPRHVLALHLLAKISIYPILTREILDRGRNAPWFITTAVDRAVHKALYTVFDDFINKEFNNLQALFSYSVGYKYDSISVSLIAMNTARKTLIPSSAYRKQTQKRPSSLRYQAMLKDWRVFPSRMLYLAISNWTFVQKKSSSRG